MKKFTSVLALVLACLLSVALIACDTADTPVDLDSSKDSKTETTTSTPDSNGNDNNNNNNGNPSDNTPPADTEPPKVDQTLEDAVKANMKNITNMTAISTINMNMNMLIDGESFPVQQIMGSMVSLNGENAYVEQVQASTLGTQTHTENTQIGSKFYLYTETESVSGSGQPQSQKAYIIIDAKAEEIAKAEEELGLVTGDIMYSINHFTSVETKNNEDGSITYTCTGLRLSAALLYQETFGAATGMMGVDGKFDINRDTTKYEVTIKDNRFVSAAIDMTVDMELNVGGKTVPVSCTYDIDEEFTYDDVPAITVPTDEGYANATVLTWDQYWDMVSDATKA